VLKYCLGCVGIVKNWDCRERCSTNAKQGDWFVFNMIHLHLFYRFILFFKVLRSVLCRYKFLQLFIKTFSLCN